ncbi:MAG: cupin domain-containing protein [Planctomycetota bacterium]|nr:cupin domain-containing protein [Planctomycetota bacterium]
MNPIDLRASLASFEETWSPRIIGEVNELEVKLAKLEGPFVWHSHSESDELFLVVEGAFVMEFRDRSVRLEAGQMIVVPRGVEHRPVAESGCSVLLVESKGTMNTGDGDPEERSTRGVRI